MPKEQISSTINIEQLFLKVIEEGLQGNKQRLELIALTAVRSLRNEFPELSRDIGAALAKCSESGVLRRARVEPPPADADAGLALVRIQSVSDCSEPILAPAVRSVVERFIEERVQCSQLLREGFAPPRTLLLTGLPGTGKTMLAQWIARQLNLPWVVLDLATSISSFLGKTGSNLRRSLDYARAMPCVLLLDEFDAIGKRRDDTTEVGELKRIVNVLLKELEEWPHHSVLIAATNHRELLDPALNRRFDVVIELPLPGQIEREKILVSACGRFAELMPAEFLSAIARSLEGFSGSDLTTLAQGVVRRHVIENVPLVRNFFEAVMLRLPDFKKEGLSHLLQSLKEVSGLSVRDIAELTGKSPTAIQYHLTKDRSEQSKQKRGRKSNG